MPRLAFVLFLLATVNGYAATSASFDLSAWRQVTSSGSASSASFELAESRINLWTQTAAQTSSGFQLSAVIPSAEDADGDGLLDTDEANLGTNVNIADTDGDGLSDFDELNRDGNPYSYTPGIDTDPLNADTDNDGLPDGAEIAAGTDPNVAERQVPTPLPAVIALLVGIYAIVRRQRAIYWRATPALH